MSVLMSIGSIDLYCERLGPGLLAEPINAITNLSFVVAAIAIWYQARRLDSLSSGILLLIGLMVAIGLGSGLFHTFATGWARVLDILPILLFQVVFMWIYGRRIIRISTGKLVAAVVIFLVSAYFCRQFQHLFNGSLIYAPALLLLIALGIYHYRHARNHRHLLLWATGVFLLSLFFRSIDMAVCEYVAFGTHFLWHVFNGVLVYLVALGLLLNLPANQEESY